MDKKRKADAVELRSVTFLLVPPITELDLVGPMSVFQGANFALLAEGREAAYRTQVVTSGDSNIVAGINHLTIVADCTLREASGKIDTLLVVGHSGKIEDATKRRAIEWLREVSPGVRRVGSICVGAFVLAATGLLNHRRATTHWNFCRELQTKHPLVKVEENPIFVCDDNLYTSAGVTAGMDLALKLIEDDLGNTIAQTVARHLVIYLRRSGEQAQISRALAAQTVENQNLRELQLWINQHLAERLNIERLAAQVAMSPRNFARVFAREFNTTPARYVLAQRLEAARREMENSRRSQDEIAVRCGFSTAEAMRRAFLREVGITPGRCRAQFCLRENPLN